MAIPSHAYEDGDPDGHGKPGYLWLYERYGYIWSSKKKNKQYCYTVWNRLFETKYPVIKGAIKHWARNNLSDKEYYAYFEADILDFFYYTGKILSTMIKVLLSTIEKILIEIRVAIHEFSVALTEWLGQDWASIIFFGLLIVFIVYGAQIIQFLAESALGLFLVDAAEAVKEGVSITAAAIHYSELITAAQIAYTVLPSFRQMVTGVRQAFISLGQEIQGNNVFALQAVTAARNLGIAMYTLTGAPNPVKEMAAFDPMIDLLSKANDRITDYIRDPMLFLDDLDRYVVEYFSEQGSTLMGAVYIDIHKNTVAIREKTTQFNDLVEAFDDFVEAMPDTVEKNIRKVWDPIKEKYDNFYDDYIVPFNEAMAEIDYTLQKYNEEMARERDKLRKEVQDTTTNTVNGVLEDNNVYSDIEKANKFKQAVIENKFKYIAKLSSSKTKRKYLEIVNKMIKRI